MNSKKEPKYLDKDVVIIFSILYIHVNAQFKALHNKLYK